MVSPRPSWLSCVPRMIVSPPSWRIATSNDTRVRVDGFSKIIASVLPASGLSRGPALWAKPGPSPAGRRPGSALAPALSCRRPLLRHLVHDAERRLDLGLADDQRRQDAQHIVAGGQQQKAFGARFGDEVAGWDHAFDAEQMARAAHLRQQLRV